MIHFYWLLSPYGWAAIALAVGLSISGCGVRQYTASTKVTYDGKSWFYESNKNQEGLKARLSADGSAEIETTASTPEASIAAALQSNLEMQKQIGAMLQVLLPMMKAAATKGVVP